MVRLVEQFTITKRSRLINAPLPSLSGGIQIYNSGMINIFVTNPAETLSVLHKAVHFAGANNRDQYFRIIRTEREMDNFFTDTKDTFGCMVL